MRTYTTDVGDTIPRIVRKTIAGSNYQSVTSYIVALVVLNNTDDGSYPVISDWTALKSGTVVRLPG